MEGEYTGRVMISGVVKQPGTFGELQLAKSYSNGGFRSRNKTRKSGKGADDGNLFMLQKRV